MQLTNTARLRRALGHGIAALATWLVAEPALAADLIPIEDFFRRPVVTSPVVSPSGQHVAATMAGGKSGRQRLVILDLKQFERSKVLAEHDDADIVQVRWVNDERLVFSVSDRKAPYGNQVDANLFAVDRKGLQPIRSLIRNTGFVSTRSINTSRELSPNHRLYGVLHDGSNDVVVNRYSADGVGGDVLVTLLRLDTATGITTSLSDGAPPHAREWALDAKGRARAVMTSEEGRSRLFVKPTGGNGAWKLLREWSTYDDKGAAVDPGYVGPDDVLYAAGDAGDGRGLDALLRIDIAAAEPKAQPLVSLQGHDFSGSLVLGKGGRLLGVRYTSDAFATHWFDPVLKRLQAQIDAALPTTVNSIGCGECENLDNVLVTAWSDRQPSTLLLYDAKAAALTTLASSRPWIDPRAMARREVLQFTARDGLKLPVTVTRPPGPARAAPAVVLVHGGPWVRGTAWQWDAETQFLASRGYVVIEPEFRGSYGFGSEIFRVGFKQWGLAMQDDVADATRWAVKQGYADAARICIAGASYGGYATLMGLARDPDLYRCGFQWVGVTDIDLMYSIHWSDFSDSWKKFGMPVLIGDREKDATQLAATSPIRLASRITQPLLMAYGGEDRRVPIDHGVKFRDAVRARNPNVEWVEYPLEGHGWSLPATDVDFWSRVERFLGRHIGGNSR